MVLYIYIDQHFSIEIAAMEKHKHGGAKKDMTKFPKIMDFLEVHHKDVYDIICDLSLEHSLIPRRGGGITFLLPDSAYIKKIRKQTDGDDPEEATDMIYSLIISDNLPDAASWREIKDDIPNLLGKKIKVHSISDSKITLNEKGNASITLCPKFKSFSRSGHSKRNNMSVWNLSGEIDYHNAETSTRAFEPKRGSAELLAKIRGSAEFRDIDMKLRQFVLNIESQEKLAIQAYASGKTSHVVSCKLRVLCNYVCSLQRIIKDSSNPDNQLAKQHFEMLKYVCDLDLMGGVEAAFYLVFGCRNTNDNGGNRTPGLHDTEFLARLIDSNALTCQYTCNLTDFKNLVNAPIGGDEKKIELIIDRLSVGIRLATIDSLKQAYSDYVASMASPLMRQKFKELGYEFKILIDQFKFDCFMLWKTWIDKAELPKLLQEYNGFLSALQGAYGFTLPHIMPVAPYKQLHYNGWKSSDSFTSPEKSYLLQFMSPNGMWRESRSRKSGSGEYEVDCVYGCGEQKVSAHSINEIRNYYDKHGKLPPELENL